MMSLPHRLRMHTDFDTDVIFLQVFLNVSDLMSCIVSDHEDQKTFLLYAVLRLTLSGWGLGLTGLTGLTGLASVVGAGNEDTASSLRLHCFPPFRNVGKSPSC